MRPSQVTTSVLTALALAGLRIVDREAYLFRGTLPGWLRWLERFNDQS